MGKSKGVIKMRITNTYAGKKTEIIANLRPKKTIEKYFQELMQMILKNITLLF